MKTPENHQSVMTYLILDDAVAFLDFVLNVFHAKKNDIIYRKDNKTIMHGEVTIDNSTIMFAQATAEYPAQTAGLFIYVEDADETFKLAIQNGAKVIMELEDKEYGRSGGIKDPCGNSWWITGFQS